MREHWNLECLSQPWALLTQAVFQNICNPLSTHIRAEDILEQVVMGKKLYTKRLLLKESSIPSWVRIWIPNNKGMAYVLEESLVDLDKQTMTIVSRNITYKRLLRTQDTEVIRRVSDNETKILSHGTFYSPMLLSRPLLEKVAHMKFKENLPKSLRALESVIRCRVQKKDENCWNLA